MPRPPYSTRGGAPKGTRMTRLVTGWLCSGEQHISQQEWECESRRGRPLLEGRQRKKSAFSENTSGETATPDKAPPALSFLSLSSLGCEVVSSVRVFPSLAWLYPEYSVLRTPWFAVTRRWAWHVRCETRRKWP